MDANCRPHTRTQPCTRRHVQPCICTHTCAHVSARRCTYPYCTSVHPSIHTHPSKHTCTYVYIHTPLYTHIRTLQLCSELPEAQLCAPHQDVGAGVLGAPSNTNHAVMLGTDMYVDHGYVCIHSVGHRGRDVGTQIMYSVYISVCLHRYVCMCADVPTLSVCAYTLQQT